ncbi:MAG: lysophospholipid acyltransferase family protein [Anaerolineales bacterium]|nr:lysophospholipid acyltransferase family protein [Anaerolineales bacterium]
MSLAESVVNATIKHLTRIICRVDDAQLAKIPQAGPLILVANHVNFLEVPLLYTHLLPRPITGIAKAETWDNAVLRPLFDLWGAIPLRRGEADVEAIRKCLDALQAGKIVAIAPEGTRSGNGRLQTARPGVVPLALRSGAPLMPVVFYGGECVHDNLARLQRTDFTILVGQPFHLDARGETITRHLRQRMVDEIMYQMAALLPPPYRGAYANLSRATQDFLVFTPPARSNLQGEQISSLPPDIVLPLAG